MAGKTGTFAKKLDRFDENLIFLLSMDSRIPMSAAARLLKASRASADYRLRRMLRGGFLRPVLLCNAPPGFHIAFLLRLRSPGKELFRKLLKTPRLTILRETLGMYDAFLLCHARSREEMEKIAVSISALLKGNLVRMDILPHGWMACPGFKSFCHRPSLRRLVSLARPGTRPLTGEESRILGLLHGDVRMPHRELARRTGISRNRIGGILAGLRQEGYLAATLYLNYRKIGLEYHHMLVRIDPAARADFERYVQGHRSVHFVRRCQGSWDYILSIASRTMGDFIGVTQEIRADNAASLLGSACLVSKLSYAFAFDACKESVSRKEPLPPIGSSEETHKKAAYHSKGDGCGEAFQAVRPLQEQG